MVRGIHVGSCGDNGGGGNGIISTTRDICNRNIARNDSMGGINKGGCVGRAT